MRVLVIPLAVLAALTLAACPPGGTADAGPAAAAAVSIAGISPRTVSNQTATPLLVFGRGFAAGQKLRLGAPFGVELALGVDDAEHAHALFPAGLVVPSGVEVKVPVALVDAQGAAIAFGQGEPLEMVVVNDTGFVDVMGLVASSDGRFAFTASQPTDELFVVDTTLDGPAAVTKVPVGDGPWSLAIATLDGAERVVVGHRYASELASSTSCPAPTASAR